MTHTTIKQTVETALRARIAQLEADVLYVRGLAERASDDADKADAQTKRLRESLYTVIETLKYCLNRMSADDAGYVQQTRELLKKYEQ